MRGEEEVGMGEGGEEVVYSITRLRFSHLLRIGFLESASQVVPALCSHGSLVRGGEWGWCGGVRW